MVNIGIIDFGTYCDMKLTYTIVKKFLKKGDKVVYITPVSNKIYVPHTNLKVITYNRC
jgi:hypothetical protein